MPLSPPLVLLSPLSVPLSPQARTILTKATRVRFRQVEDLAAVWCEFGELELRHHNYEAALRVLRVRHPPGDTHGLSPLRGREAAPGA